MSQTTTKPTADEKTDQSVDPSQKIDSLEKRIEELTAKLEAARQDEQKLIDQQEKISEKISSRKNTLGEIEQEIHRAQAELKDAERSLPAPPVDKATAEHLAQGLIAAFENVDDAEEDGDGPKPVEARATALWSAIDDTEARLLTDQVDEDVRLVVLAIEGVLRAAADWEAARRPDFAGAKGADGEPLRDIRGEIFPSRSTVVKVMLQELNAVLAGEEPGSIEEVGTLLGQNVAPGQIARMHGLLLADGSPDLETLGFLVDRALGKTGFYAEANPWRHLKRMGALSAADAWKLRSVSLPSRRERASHLPGSVQRAGQWRPGRDVRAGVGNNVSQQADLEDVQMNRFLYEQSRRKAEAANQPAAEGDAAPADYSALTQQMARRV